MNDFGINEKLGRKSKKNVRKQNKYKEFGCNSNLPRKYINVFGLRKILD